ncbi:MAG: tRNA-intron lyase [Candidatus Woesearchaeota archaeon]|nr:tRNA-intron lyase [Candidatus Woesearchaeota archaeon]
MADRVKAVLAQNRIITENSNEAKLLFDQSVFGAPLADGRIQLSNLEALYLFDKEKVQFVNSKGKPIAREQALKQFTKAQANFWTDYAVFSDLREKGYVVKTALKFGADFRVYDRGVKPGEDHARWVVFAVDQAVRMTWQDFAAKNRVAHSTKKKLLIAVVDNEGDVSYWESGWLKP